MIMCFIQFVHIDVFDDAAEHSYSSWHVDVALSAIIIEGNRQMVTLPSAGRPGGVVRVYNDDHTDSTSSGLIPYCSISQAQISYHGYKDAVKFFIAVPGTSAAMLLMPVSII